MMARHRFVRARLMAGLTVNQAAVLLKRDPRDLAQDEARQFLGDLTGSQISAMAKLYGVTVAWLLGARPQVPEHIIEALDDAGIDGKDREIILETAASWYTREYS